MYNRHLGTLKVARKFCHVENFKAVDVSKGSNLRRNEYIDTVHVDIFVIEIVSMSHGHVHVH